MKYFSGLLIILLLYTQSVKASYCVYDCENNKVLEGKTYDTIQSVASISKVMTAIIVLEHASLYESVLITSEMVDEEGSSIYINEGDVYSIESLLYGLLLRSGNDAALALAMYISEYDMESFVSWMNDLARQLGMLHTKFENPSGLEQPFGNQSTAYDMALLMCYASKYEELLNIMQTTSYKNHKQEVWYNKNRLLSMNDKVIGGKTGFTKKAGRTLVSIAENPNKISIASFRIPNDFKFHDELYRKWFKDAPMVKLFSKGEYLINNYTFVIEEDEFIPWNDFDSKDITMYLESDEVVIKYKDLIWKYPLVSEKSI